MRPALSVLVLFPAVVFANAGGISGYSGKMTGTLCTACHTGGVVPTVTVTGPSTIAPNQPATFLVTITSAAAVVVGFNAALGGPAAPGSTLTPGAGVQLLTGELTHVAPGRVDGGTYGFSFNVTAGAINGNLTLYVAGVAGNGNALSTGDNAASLTRTVTVFGDAGTPPVDTDAGSSGTGGGGGGTGGSGGGTDTTGGAGLARPGGFVDGDMGCSTTGGLPTALLLTALLLVTLVQRRSTKSTCAARPNNPPRS